MIKPRILTAIATVLSLLIVYSGWFLTNELLERQQLSLINKVHFISVKEPSEPGQIAKPVKDTLSTREMATILKVWRSGQTKNYHDPYEGQLTMEEAIKAANSGLSYFGDNGILPEEILNSGFTRTNAFLYDMQTVRGVLAEVAPVPDPAHSFWSVSLINREVSVELTLNALTGRIWMADISSSSLDVNFDGLKALDMLEQYEAYLGLNGGGGLRSDEAYAFKSYDNNPIGITVHKKAGESGHYGSLHFSLTSTG